MVPGSTIIRPLRTERGIALLLVLWVIVFLAFVCAEFSWTMRTETATAVNFKEGVQAYYAAEAGINRAIIELMRASHEGRRVSRAARARGIMDAHDDDDAEDQDDLRLWLAGGGPYRFKFGDYYCEVRIVDETNKININEFLSESKKDPVRLKAFLEKHLGLEGEERDTVASSLIDWWDKDSNVTGVHGAEEDYYQSLDPPYPCRNGDIPVIEELLLVRGVTPRIFYGRSVPPEERIQLTAEDLEVLLAGGELGDPDDEEELPEDDEDIPVRLGLVDLFSTSSNASSFRINVNSASFEQLMLLEGMETQTAQEIIAEREIRLFESPTDRLPQYAHYVVWKDMIRVQRPFTQSNYTVHVRGFSRDGRVSRSIRCNLVVSTARCVITDWRIDG